MKRSTSGLTSSVSKILQTTRRSKRKSRRSTRRTGIQPLEPRHLLAADPIAHWLAQDLSANLDDGAVVTSGGRVLCVVGLGNSVQAAADEAYATVEQIAWEDVYFRRDIGHRAIARERT